MEGEDGELYRLEIRNGRKVLFTPPSHDSSKSNTEGGGNGRTDKECFRCGRICHIRADWRARTFIDGGLPKSALKGKGLGSCEEEGPEASKNVPLVTIDLGSFEGLSDHGGAVEDDVDDVEEFSEEEELCHRHRLLPGSRRQGLQSIQRCIVGSSRNIAVATIAETAKSLRSSIVWIGSLSCLMFCSRWILGHETHQSL